MKPFIFTASLLSSALLPAQTADTPIYEQRGTANKQTNQQIIKKALRVREQVSAISKVEIDRQSIDPVPEPVQLPPALSQAMSPADIADHARKTNLRVGYCYKCNSCDEWHINLAGGYAIAANAIVTCDHVLATKTKMRDGFLVAVDHEGNVACGTAILARSTIMDAAIIKVAGAELTPVPLNSEVRQGSASYCFSHPLSQQGFFSTGIINRFFWNGTYVGGDRDSIDALCQLRVNFSNDWAPGSSGSPLFDPAGNVIGHVSTIAGLSSGKDQPTLLMMRTGIPALAVRRFAATLQNPAEITRIAKMDANKPETSGTRKKSNPVTPDETGKVLTGEKPAAGRPVKIFILSGQSNMTGRGALAYAKLPEDKQQSTLIEFVNRPENRERLAYLRNGPQKSEDGWTIRDDVFITTGEWPHLKPGDDGYDAARKHGGLGPDYGGRGNRGFGPELAIGNLLGNRFDETVLLVKVAFGGNSLGKNYRPPGSGGATGDKYPAILKAYQDAIAHLPEMIPGYTAERGHELAGFLWNQGLSDGSPEFSREYGQNLTHLIKDLRRDLAAPTMPFVVAVTGNWGWGDKALLENHARHREKHPDFSQERSREIIDGLQRVQQAQLAVSQLPEFKGNVATAETRDFWRPRETHGGNGTEEHWNANGESYWLIGEAMAGEMLKLLDAGSSLTNPSIKNPIAPPTPSP